jgi:hypothetical protein
MQPSCQVSYMLLRGKMGVLMNGHVFSVPSHVLNASNTLTHPCMLTSKDACSLVAWVSCNTSRMHTASRVGELKHLLSTQPVSDTPTRPPQHPTTHTIICVPYT